MHPQEDTISVFEDSNSISPWSSHKAEQTSSLTRSLYGCSNLLATLVCLKSTKSRMSFCLLLGNPRLNTVLQMWSHKYQMQGKNHSPWLAGSTLVNTAQDVVACLYCKGTLLAHVHLIVLQDPHVLFLRNCFLARQCPPCIAAQGYSSPHAGYCIFLRWSSWGSICPACLGPDFWPIDHSPHVWYCPQTCWEYVLSHQPYW